MDKDVLVVEKPAGLTTVRHASERAEFGDRAQRFLPTTLLELLTTQLAGRQKGRLRAVHRLDKETSGLVLLARTAEAERGFGLQFREHDVERSYLALVRGRATNQTITSHLIRDRGDGRRGSGPDQLGQLAVTHVKVVEELAGFTLVECRLETGRTHQVRIHLGEQGTPLCGEQVYDRPVHGQPHPDDSGALRPALHAATLAFEHPVTKKRLNFESPLPEDMRKLLKRLRKRA
jgi:23S rRNA pseudouridine1911/1915/1917 synthase